MIRPLALLLATSLVGAAGPCVARADDTPPAGADAPPAPSPPASPPAPSPSPKAAPAGAATPVELPRRAGAPVVGVVERCDAKEVALRVGAELRTLPWEEFAPLGVFRARAALAPPDDGPSRLALAELAADLGLYVEARREYERALGLRAIEPGAYAKAVADAEARAVATGLAEAERAADAGDADGALATLRRLTLDFGGAVDPRRVAALVAAVAAKVEARAAEQRALAEEEKRLVVESARKKEILVRMTAARRDRTAGDASAQDARGQMPKGVVSRVRRFTEEADDAYGAARRGLGRLRRLVGREGPEHAAWVAALDDLERARFALLFDAAKFFWDARVYAAAEEYAARASWIDPVDSRLLELRADIRGHRIRYRASDVTNARGTTR